MPASFGELLRRFRIANGVSQETLAERARISPAAVSALERGARRAPYRETVTLLANALGLSVTEQAELEAEAARARVRKTRNAYEPPRAHDLPNRLTSFIGREEEIAKIRDLLKEHRLVTVTGSGGVGKTRLAVEIARQRVAEEHEEAWFADLSPVVDGAFVAGAIASALELRVNNDDALRALVRRIRSRKLLLIIDNCEHVIEDAAIVASELLRNCPEVTMLATSRERLSIEGERVYRLPSLLVPEHVPETTEEAYTYESFRLFMDRAAAIEFPLELTPERLKMSTEICRQLEGIPLAIELAATRLPSLGLDELTQRLKEHFLVATGSRDLPQRQRTMLATIAWSYDLLSEPEQTLLWRLTTFHGSPSLEAVESVCSDDTLPRNSVAKHLSSLVDKSLLSADPAGGRIHYAMLESVRAFATEKLLEADQYTSIARAHAAWLAMLADRGHEGYSHDPMMRWLREFEPELDNVRKSLEWALAEGNDEDVVCAGRIVGGLRGLWISTGRWIEGARWAEAVLKKVDARQHPFVVERVLRLQVQCTFGPSMFALAARSIPVFELTGDRHALASLHAHLAYEHSKAGRFEEAERAIALASSFLDEDGTQDSHKLHILLNRFLLHLRLGRVDEARIDFKKMLELPEILSEVNDGRRLYWEALLEFFGGRVERAVDLFEEYLCTNTAEPQQASVALCALADSCLLLGNFERAESAARSAIELRLDHQVDPSDGGILQLAAVAAVRGQARAAARLLGFVDAVFAQRGWRRTRTWTDDVSYDKLRTSLREQLSSEVLDALAADGARMDHYQAADEALNI